MIRNFMSAEATVINIEIIAYYWGYYKNAMFQDFQHFWQHLACRPNFSTKRVFSMSLQTNSQSLQAATDITNFTRKDGKYQKHFTKTLQTFQTALHVSVVPFPSHFHSGLHKDKQIPFFKHPYLLSLFTFPLNVSKGSNLYFVKVIKGLAFARQTCRSFTSNASKVFKTCKFPQHSQGLINVQIFNKICQRIHTHRKFRRTI